MANQAIALRDEQTVGAARSNQITDVQRLGGLLAASGYFSDAREMAQAAVKVLAGEELGIPPVAAMMGIAIIKGKIALGANLIASRIRAHGYEYRHKQFDATACVLTFFGKAAADGKRETLGESSFTIADAQAAQIKSEMYQKFPRNMLFARAISNGARWYTPEVFAGAPVYTPEELGAPVDEQGDYVAPAPAPTVTQQQVAESKIAQMKAGVPYAETVMPVTVPPEQQVPEAVTEMWSRMKDIASVCEMFANLKSRLADATGGDDTYYRILAEYGNGAKHANTLKQKAARQCCWRLYDAILAAEAAIEPPLDMDEPGGAE